MLARNLFGYSHTKSDGAAQGHGQSENTRQHFPSAASHSSASAQMQQILETPTHGQDTRSFLEREGVIRKSTGQKRKHGSGSARPYERSSAMNASFGQSEGSVRSERKLASSNGPLFKLPQSLHGQRQANSTLSAGNEGGVHLYPSDQPTKKRRIGSINSPPRTPDADLTSPLASNNRTPHLSEALSANYTNAFGIVRKRPSAERADATPTRSSGLPKIKRPKSTASVLENTRDAVSRSITPGTGSVPLRHGPKYKPPKRRPSVTEIQQQPKSSSTRHQTNHNGSRFIPAPSIQVPTIDQRLQCPPPDNESLTRILSQVPGFLTDLNKKQTEVIRDLATRVNEQEEQIKALKSDNLALHKHISMSENMNAHQIMVKLEAIERMMADQEQQISELRTDNEELQDHVNRTGEYIAGQVDEKIKNMESKIMGREDSESNDETLDVQNREAIQQEEAADVFQGLMTPHKRELRTMSEPDVRPHLDFEDLQFNEDEKSRCASVGI